MGADPLSLVGQDARCRRIHAAERRCGQAVASLTQCACSQNDRSASPLTAVARGSCGGDANLVNRAKSRPDPIVHFVKCETWPFGAGADGRVANDVDVHMIWHKVSIYRIAGSIHKLDHHPISKRISSRVSFVTRLSRLSPLPRSGLVNLAPKRRLQPCTHPRRAPVQMCTLVMCGSHPSFTRPIQTP